MEKTSMQITQATDEFPSGLKNAKEAAESIKGISASRLTDLADAGYAPHFRIDGGEPLFKVSETKRWLAKNLLGECMGRKLEDAIRVVVPADEISIAPPASIEHIELLQQLPVHGYQPGVYFLCKKGEVVYVGQSSTPVSRIAQHSASKKDFDRVYLLPVPAYELNNVEAAFIHLLRPSQQGYHHQNKAKPVAPTMTKSIESALEGIGISVDHLEVGNA